MHMIFVLVWNNIRRTALLFLQCCCGEEKVSDWLTFAQFIDSMITYKQSDFNLYIDTSEVIMKDHCFIWHKTSSGCIVTTDLLPEEYFFKSHAGEQEIQYCALLRALSSINWRMNWSWIEKCLNKQVGNYMKNKWKPGCRFTKAFRR